MDDFHGSRINVKLLNQILNKIIVEKIQKNYTGIASTWLHSTLYYHYNCVNYLF